jgi:hypothetical protein
VLKSLALSCRKAYASHNEPSTTNWRALAELADRMEGRPPGAKPREEWLAPLERTVRAYDVHEPQKQTAIRLPAFLSLHRRVETIATSLQKDLNIV